VTAVLGQATQLASLHVASGCTIISANQEFCTVSTGLTVAGIVFIALAVGVAVLSIVAGVKIVSKAGYSGWWVLIAFVPVVGTVFLFIFAFSDWPILREVRLLRGGSPGPRGAGGWRQPYGGADAGATGQGASVEDAPMPSFASVLRGEPPPPGTGPPAHPNGPVAGWYPAPEGPPGRLRYWDGSTWTEHYR
jgi:hypothetical protein